MINEKWFKKSINEPNMILWEIPGGIVNPDNLSEILPIEEQTGMDCLFRASQILRQPNRFWQQTPEERNLEMIMSNHFDILSNRAGVYHSFRRIIFQVKNHFFDNTKLDTPKEKYDKADDMKKFIFEKIINQLTYNFEIKKLFEIEVTEYFSKHPNDNHFLNTLNDLEKIFSEKSDKYKNEWGNLTAEITKNRLPSNTNSTVNNNILKVLGLGVLFLKYDINPEGLKSFLEENGPVIVYAYIGVAFYKSKPKTEVIHGKTIHYWLALDRRVVDPKDTTGHAIIVTGVSIDQKEPYVYYTDPSSPSSKDELPPVYKISFGGFKKYVEKLTYPENIEALGTNEIIRAHKYSPPEPKNQSTFSCNIL